MKLPAKVKMIEVGPRDGLQNETKFIPTDIKVELINRLAKTGLKNIEVTSFVSPKWIPQLADNSEVLQKIQRFPDVHYSALVPNSKGFVAALAAKVNEIAIFTAASETFAQKNMNCSITESFERYSEVIAEAKKHSIPVRGYISCVLGCPYEGYIKPSKVAEVAAKLFTMGCYEISLGDTIGTGTPKTTQQLIETVSAKVALGALAVHFHDTYGQALTNIYTALECGIAIVDSSVAGLGGCPYAPGASGNVASEDVVYMLNGLEIKTGVNLAELVKVGQFISDYLGRPSRSKVGQAMQGK